MIRRYNFRDFKTNDNDREIDHTLPFNYTCSLVSSDIREAIGGNLPFHWHNDIEVSYLVEGEVNIYVGQTHIRLSQGQAIYLNANAIHSLKTVSPAIPASLITIRFHPEYIGGNAQTSLSIKYVNPIVDNEGFPFYHIRADYPGGLKMLAALNGLKELCESEPPGYELRIHNYITDFWCELFYATEKERKLHSQILNNEHIRPMLDYIKTHLTEQMKLEDIAAAGLVSSRECSRLFAKYVHQSPISYVNFCRLRQAATLLLSTDKNVTEIGEDCGFSSLSYFSKMFEREFSLRPMEYRKQFGNIK